MDNMTLQTVDRALTLMEMIAEEPITQQEIEQKTGLNRTTVSRLLTTLMLRKYIEKNEANRYQIGLKAVEIASLRLNQIELKTEAVPLLRQLSMKLGQVCHIGMLSDGEVVYIEKIEPVSSIRMFSAIGKRVPVHSTSLGKVLASGLNDDEIKEIFKQKGMEQLTENTITDPEEYIREIHTVREKGFAEDREENEMGIRCIAAPVRDYRNQIVAAISTSGYQTPMTTEYGEPVRRQVMETAKEISLRLGMRHDYNDHND